MLPTIRKNSKTTVFLLGLIAAIVITAIETFRLRYANYLVFSDSTLDFWNGVNPYSQEFVNNHGRYFLYTPVFSVLFLPIALLPKWLGPFVWNVMNYSLFALSVFTLPKRYDNFKVKIFLFLLLVLEQSLFAFQYNIVVAYIFLFAFNLLERGKAFWAVLLIMVSATTKVYGIVELLLLFCYPKVWRNLLYATAIGLALLFLPALKVGLDGLLPCYMNWWNMLAQHQDSATYASLLYTFPLSHFLEHYRIVQLITIGIVVAVFFVQLRRNNDFTFRATTLGVLMGWIIVFGDSSETHTYLIALTGYMLWYRLKEHYSITDKTLFWLLLFFFGVVPTDVLMPTPVHNLLNGYLFIDVYLYAVVWTMMLFTMAHHRRKT